VTLGQKQELLARLIPKLFKRALELGFQIRPKELLRSPVAAKWNATHCAHLARGSSPRRCEQAKRAHHDADHDFVPIGIADSLHCDGLAIDIILTNAGKPLWATRRYRALGLYWEGLDPLCAWGGRFGDGGHFSIRHRGKR
jgi:hypothetical protein